MLKLKRMHFKLPYGRANRGRWRHRPRLATTVGVPASRQQFEMYPLKAKLHFPIFIILVLFSTGACSQQQNDSLFLHSFDSSLSTFNDSSKLSIDTLVIKLPKIKTYRSVVEELLSSNKFINVKESPVYFIAEKKEMEGKEFLFYTLCFIVFILGIFKTFYKSYFNNLFRVFLNTSIRQTQLTDQLLQAKQPSFILNVFFIISTGIYVWLLFKHYHPPRLISNTLLLPFCIIGIGVLYFIKYCILKFIGWMSGMQQATDNYIFVIFLVNKIVGIVLVPFIILLAFSLPQWVNYISTFSLLLLGFFFLSRYIKTYGALEYKFPLQPFHFIIYVAAVEVVPFLIIYKVVLDYFI